MYSANVTSINLLNPKVYKIVFTRNKFHLHLRFFLSFVLKCIFILNAYINTIKCKIKIFFVGYNWFVSFGYMYVIFSLNKYISNIHEKFWNISYINFSYDSAQILLKGSVNSAFIVFLNLNKIDLLFFYNNLQNTLLPRSILYFDKKFHIVWFFFPLVSSLLGNCVSKLWNGYLFTFSHMATVFQVKIREYRLNTFFF